jgi:hypothetical protein
MLPKKKNKKEKSAAAHWCFKVYSQYSTAGKFKRPQQMKKMSN